MTHKQLWARADQHFSETNNRCWATEDGNVFIDQNYSLAVLHARATEQDLIELHNGRRPEEEKTAVETPKKKK